MLTPEEVRQLDPGVEYDIIGAAYFPGEIAILPRTRLWRGSPAICKKTAWFSWNCEVTGWRPEGENLTAVITSQGVINADKVVLATGFGPGRPREG